MRLAAIVRAVVYRIIGAAMDLACIAGEIAVAIVLFAALLHAAEYARSPAGQQAIVSSFQCVITLVISAVSPPVGCEPDTGCC